MANPNISVDVSGNTAKLRQQINQVAKQPLVIDIQAGGRGAAQPLGKLSGQITEIDKSLAAANARVIAFGAAAGSIFALQNAVLSLFQSFVNTEKKLQDINVILNLSEKNLAAFGSSLFDIAGDTAQAFDVVAEAATELSRQGLGVEETLKRTQAALILTRLSGLDAAASVAALTATMNSFQSATLEATEIVNKLANVDAAFAVSSADLANALSRVGSSADDAGISFDELIALVTTAQQITARGGAVIGNSLKTIFTRLGREKVQDVLGGLGISATDESGQVKTQIQLLKELALVYDTLGATQKNYVAEQVGGVFQINILKAALGDLGKEYSIYDRALKTSLSSTDQAIQRNEKLNQTLSALGTKTLANVQKVAGTLGEGLFGDAARNVLNLTNLLTESVANADSQSVGGQIGKGVIDGLGKFIAGPGLALATAIIVKLLAEFTKYGAEAFKSILGANQAGKEQAIVQQNIAKFLQNNSSLYNSILKGQTSVSAAAKEYLTVIQQQTLALQKQNSVAASISKSVAGTVGVATVGGKQYVATKGKQKTAASGYLPESIEQANINARVGGANPITDRPVTIPNFAFGGGKKGKVTAHTGEWVVPNFAGGDGTAIFNKDMKKKYGLPDGAHKISASGFIPNFAKDSNYVDQKRFAAGKVFDNAIALALKLKTAYVEDRDVIDFAPNVLSAGSIDKKVKQELGISFKTLYGDAKLSAKEGNQASFISKIIRIGGKISPKDKSGNYTVTPPGSGGSILIPGQDGKTDYNITARAGVGAILKKNPSLKEMFNRLGMEKGSSVSIPNVLVDSVRNITGKNVFGSISGKGKDFSKFQTRAEAATRISGRFNRGFASGFIPNFAKASKAETINLGDISTNRSYSGKLVSAVIPQPTNQLLKFPAQAEYRGRLYSTTALPVSGPNQKVTKKLSQQNIPRLHKNIGQVVLDQANVFGQSLGATKFMSSVSELPNLGGVNSAAGVSFEGGVANALGQSVGSKNARVDFSSQSLNPKIRKIFNNAPGSYEAKNRPSSSLINDVFSKFLSRIKPDAVKQVRSGANFGKVQRLRDKAVESIRKEGLVLRRGGQFEKEVEKRMAALQSSGAADGFIPNFAPNISAIEELVKRGATLGERSAAQAALSRIQSNALLKLGSPEKLGKFKSLLYGSNSNAGFNLDAIRIGDLKYKPLVENAKLLGLSTKDLEMLSKNPVAIKELRNYGQSFKKRSEFFAGGFIPNFADSAILEQIQSKSSFNYKEIKNKPGIEKRINKLYEQYPNLQYLGSGAESHAFKNGNRVLKLPTLDYKTAKQQKAKAKEIGSIDWATATRQLKKAEPNLQLMPIRRVSGSSLVTSQRFAGNTFKDEINDYDVENSLMNLVESKFERAKASVSEKPNWLRALSLDTGSSANFTFMRSLPKEVQIQAREGQIPPESLITSNKVGLIDPVIYGFMAERLWSEAKAKTGRSLASGFVPNFANNSTNKGIPVSKIRAHFDKSGNPIAVTNTIHEPNGLKDAIKRERMGIGMSSPKSSGFIPNFAVGDEGETQGGLGDFAKSIGAVATQIALFASISQLGKKDVNELKETYKQRAEIERKAISQQKANLQKMSTMGPGPLQRGSSAYNAAMLNIEQRAQTQRAARRSSTGTLQQGISSVKGFRPGIGTAFVAPIIAETIANAIPQNTQGGRVGASAVSGAGQIASFAGTGGMVGMAFGPQGAAVGAALGAVTGGLIGLTDILKQLNTNLPELQAKAEKSTEELAKVNEKTQGLATSYETYTRLLEENASQSELKKAEQNYINYLNSFDPETAKKFTNAIKERGMQGLTEVSGQITQKQAEQTANNQAAVSVEQLLNTQRRSIIAKAFDFVGRYGSGPNTPGMQAGKQTPIETYSGEMTKDIRDAFKKQINAGITQGLTDSDLETRLKELGGKEQIQKDFGKLISDTLKIDPKGIEGSSGFKKILSELYGEVFDEVGINIKGQAEKTRSLASGAIKDASKKIAQQLSQDIDSLLSYNKNKSGISQLESDFFGGEIGQNEFVARRSQERIKEALSLGATPEEIFTRFGSDVKNVQNQASNNAAQRAFDLGLPVDYQNRARMLSQQAVGEATGTNKLGVEYLKNRFLPEGGKLEGSSKEVEAAIKALQQLGGFADRSEAFKAYETVVNAMAFDLTTSAGQAAANFKSIESSVQAILEYFTTAAEKSSRDQPQPSNFEKPISLTDSSSVVPSININPGPVSFTLGGLTREDLDLKLTAEKQRILDEFSAKMQQLKAQNNLK